MKSPTAPNSAHHLRHLFLSRPKTTSLCEHPPPAPPPPFQKKKCPRNQTSACAGVWDLEWVGSSSCNPALAILVSGSPPKCHVLCTLSVSARFLALQALRLPIDVTLYSDSKKTSRKWIQYHWCRAAPGTHLFRMNDSAIHGGICDNHGAICRPAGSPDIVVAGLPCQPFSNLRSRKGSSSKTQSAHQHPETAAIDEFVTYLRCRSPLCFVIENVLSLGSEIMQSGETYIRYIARCCADLGYSVRTVNLHLDDWVKSSRPRMWCLGVCKEAGGCEAADWLVQGLEASLDYRQREGPPTDPFSILDVPHLKVRLEEACSLKILGWSNVRTATVSQCCS